MIYKNFITFEGGEASGKTSLIEEITKFLGEKELDFLKTREPGGNKISEEIRQIILDEKNIEMDYRCEALLYAASRIQHLALTIMPALEANKVVICDRYVDSSLAYQGIARGLGIKEVKEINAFAFNVLPGLTFFIDIKPEIALKRLENNNRIKDRLDLEKKEFHEKVYEGYLTVAKLYPERIKVIDGNREIEIIKADIIKILKEYFKV